jgi:hypothetical protein
MEEFLESAGRGAIWGFGFGVAGLLVTGLGRGLRPVAKSVVKGGIVAGDWVRSVTAEGRESMQDLYEEAKAEQEQAKSAAAASAERSPTAGSSERSERET